MVQLPESILYKSRCTFLLGVTFMTPFCAIVLNFFISGFNIKSFYDLILLSMSLFGFKFGYWFIIETYYYIVRKENEYASSY